MNYRPEIDGLRAIAVISVILSHINLLEGGFLGVDIFFVISGYLITGIILADLNKRQFSFANFYERRARRIINSSFSLYTGCMAIDVSPSTKKFRHELNFCHVVCIKFFILQQC